MSTLASKSEPWIKLQFSWIFYIIFVYKENSNSQLSDFKRNLEKDNVFRTETGEGQLDSITTKLVVIGISVPNRHETISLNKSESTEREKIPYGLKRILKVEVDETKTDNSYMYVKINNSWTFLRKSQMFWFDGVNRKTYIDAVREGKDISSLRFFNEYNPIELLLSF